MEPIHIPVLRKEALEMLGVIPGIWYIDATFGRGGHTKEIMNAGGNIIAIDCDDAAIGWGLRMFVKEIEEKKLKLVHENFDKLSQILAGFDEKVRGNIGGILADFGVSSPQLEEAQRGFSFEVDAPLDMRMDKRLGVRAADLVNALGKRELFELLTTYAQEHHARVIVDAILKARSKKPIETTKELANIIERVVHREGRLHPATKAFMAIRMAVNDELGVIHRFLPQALDALQKDGRLVMISFHEGEDRLVKQFCKQMEDEGKIINLTKKPMEASEEEVTENVRSRSAKLRVIQKL